MTIDRIGESLLILRDFECSAAMIADSIRREEIKGVIDVIPSYRSVGVIVDAINVEEIIEILQIVCKKNNYFQQKERIIHLEICFELGLDFVEALRVFNMEKEDFIERFQSITFECYAIGFSPGFPYLGYLPNELSQLERRATPRSSVPSGSVGISGRQVGIYPQETPGGWWLIGRSPHKLMTLEPPTCEINVGDKVIFEAISEIEFAARFGKRSVTVEEN